MSDLLVIVTSFTTAVLTTFAAIKIKEYQPFSERLESRCISCKGFMEEYPYLEYKGDYIHQQCLWELVEFMIRNKEDNE